MDLLSNTAFQFFITTSISLLLGGISVWLAMRRPIQIPLLIETLILQRVDPSNEEVKELLATIHIAPTDSRVQYLQFVTVKIYNNGKESVTFTEDKPGCIIYKRGATILACEGVETVPQELDHTYWLEDEKLLLAFPLLDPKESITLRLLIAGSVYPLPEVDIRVPGSKHIVIANNVQMSKELLILGIFYLCAIILLSISASSLFSLVFLSSGMWWMVLAGPLFIFSSWLERKSHPSRQILPSEMLWAFVKVLPVTIPFGILLVVIYHWFGMQTFAYVVIIFVWLVCTFALWLILCALITFCLKKMKIKYNAILVGILASIPSIAFLALWVPVFLMIFLHILHKS